MTLLAIVVLGLVIALSLSGAPLDGLGSKNLLSARNLVLCLFAVYYMFPAILVYLNDGRFTWAPSYSSDGTFLSTVVLALGGLVCFVLGYHLFGGKRAAAPLPAEAEDCPDRVSGPERPLAWGMVLVGVVLKLWIIVQTGGATDAILRLSGSIRASEGLEDVASFYIIVRSLSSVAEAGAAWLFLDALRVGRPTRTYALLIAAVMALSFVGTGKRLTLLLPLLAIAVGVHVFRRRVTVLHTPLFLLLGFGVGMATLFFRVFAPANAAGVRIRVGDAGYGSGSLFDFYAYSLEFATVDTTAVALRSGERVAGMYGGAWDAFVTTSLLPFLYVIPRAVFPWKPDTFSDLSYGLSATLTGGGVLNAEVGYASTLIGTSVIVGGIAGVVVSSVLLGVVAQRIDRLADVGEWSVRRVMAYAILLNLAFHLFRQGTLGWAFIIAVVQQIGFLAGTWMLWRRSQRVAARSTPSPRVKS